MSEPRWAAQMDQMLAGLRDVARATAAFYRTLLDEGVAEQSATQMAGALAVGMVTQSRGDDA